MNRLEIHGNCGADPAHVLQLAAGPDHDLLVTLPGNYALIVREAKATLLVASSFGPPNLYYAHVDGRLFVGARLLDVVQQAGLPWRWNWRALADLTALEHCVVDDTLHADIRKLTPGMLIRCDANGLHARQVPWSRRTQCANASPRAATEALVEACLRQAGADPVVSMSAGFDSRLLLACLLSAGLKPTLLTMGAADSTDATVASAIAGTFGLPLTRVELQAEQYWDVGAAVTTISGGAKTLQNWHTYLYAKAAELPRTARLFIGSNGEAARSYYLDKGMFALAAQAWASDRAKHAFWQRKLQPIFTPEERALLVGDFARQFAPEQTEPRVQRMLELTPGPLLAGLDVFYTEQRVAHFIGNGLALAAAHAHPVAPMLDRSWMAQIWNLPREWKLDCAWHRYAIAQLCPRLLRFPEEKTRRPMRAAPSAGYWLRRGPRDARVPYIDYVRFLQRPDIAALANGLRDEIGAIADPQLITLVLQRHAQEGNRLRALSFLVAMLHWSQTIRHEIATKRRHSAAAHG